MNKTISHSEACKMLDGIKGEFFTVVFVSACMEASEPPASKADRSKLPSPIVLVGDAAAGEIAAAQWQ